MTKKMKIEVTNLSKIYKMYAKPTDRMLEALLLSKADLHTDFYALSDISFRLFAGDILGIMGRNGSGKSTLLKIITGILTPSGGAVWVDGRISSLLELGAGFNVEYTGIENIYFYGTLMGMSTEQMNERLKDIIDFAEIGDYINQPVKTYSSGMFARLAFSCAINVEPDILIVDEILSVGDIRFQAKCFNKFKDFKQQGITIIYVGHDIGTMRSFCDICMWLNDGKVVEMGDPTYVSSQYIEFMYSDNGDELTQRDLSDENRVASIESHINGNKFLAHWGKCCGLIKNIKMTDDGNKDVTVVTPGTRVLISFDIENSNILDHKFLSAAFSIKNREGIDLIVQTTHDKGIGLEKKGTIHIAFEFTMNLNKGEYYLTLALENRENSAISYYEYIEGAKYFKVSTPSEVYGLFLLGEDAKITTR